MNKKGLYSGGVALATIVLVIAISFNITSTVQAGESQSKADAIIDAKWEAENAKFLLEAVAVDAIVDGIFDQGCTYNASVIGPLVENKVENQYTLGPEQSNCVVSTVTYEGQGSNDAYIEIKMDCDSTSREGLTAYYSKKIMLYKTITVSSPVPPETTCQITIEDTSGHEKLFSITANINE